MLKAPILILVLLQVINLNAAPTEDDYYYYDEYDYDLEDTEFGSENICQLPKELGSFGKNIWQFGNVKFEVVQTLTKFCFSFFIWFWLLILYGLNFGHNYVL